MIGTGLWGREGYGTPEARGPGPHASGGTGAKHRGQRGGPRGERRRRRGGARGRRIAWGRGEASWAGSRRSKGTGAGHRKGAGPSESVRATGVRLPGGL